MTKHVHWLSSEPSNKLVHREVKGQPAHSKWKMWMLLVEAVAVVVDIYLLLVLSACEFQDTNIFKNVPPPKKKQNQNKQINKNKPTHTWTHREKIIKKKTM